jgi:hypothetical protein
MVDKRHHLLTLDECSKLALACLLAHCSPFQGIVD